MGLIQPKPLKDSLYLNAGKFYFRPEGEADFQYFGASSEATLTIDKEFLEYLNSEDVPITNSPKIETKTTISMSLALTQLSKGALAIWSSGETVAMSQSAGSLDTTKDVVPGYTYLLDYRALSNFAVKNSDDSITYEEGRDYRVNGDVGLLSIMSDGAIENETIHITADYADATWEKMLAATTKSLRGELMFESIPVVGEPAIWRFFDVQISGDGDFALKSPEDWNAATFTVNVFKDESRQGVGLSQYFEVS